MRWRAFGVRGKTLGVDHRDTGSLHSASAGNLGAVLHDQKNESEVEIMHRHAAEGGGSSHRPRHPDVLLGVVGLAATLFAERKYEEGEIMYRQSLSAMEKALGPDHPGCWTDFFGCSPHIRSVPKAKQHP
ncbi:hypothetical protein HOY80DRAFT_978716 [Tuber brumale]|nr:hypothetical protein HOY80DRAFT_978716 [Tuber brumale]